jgi:hypothetical protein
MFAAVEEPDPAQDAVKYLEKDKPDEAIKLLKKEVAKDPDNYELVGLLAAAYGLKAGIETFKLIENLAKEDDTEEEGSGGAVGSLGAVLPEPTEERINFLNYAIELLESIPESSRRDSDNFLLSLYITSAFTLQIMMFDLDGDGKFSVIELAQMTADDAQNLMNNLISAVEVAAMMSSSDGAQSGAAAEKIGGIKDKIDASEGASTEEKLKNYLKK